MRNYVSITNNRDKYERELVNEKFGAKQCIADIIVCANNIQYYFSLSNSTKQRHIARVFH